jgi:hypothetical protein
MNPSNPVPDQTAPAQGSVPRPAGLDAPLDAVAAQLPASDPDRCADTLAGMSTPAERAARAEQLADTLPAWLCNRYRRYAFPDDRRTWEQLHGDDRSFWEHEAAAVRRAVDRGGFKAQAVSGEPK